MRARVPLHRAAVLAAVALPLAFTVTANRSETIASAAPLESAAKKAPPPSEAGFRLPWGSGASQYLTQDANDDCCSDHVGSNKYAFDFASWDGTPFEVVAPAAGTVVHVKMSSKHGCGDSSCVNDANYLVIDHGDGTQTTFLHLAYGSLDPQIQCGTFVRRGQKLATTGSTGWSTGVHLHVERDQVKKNLKEVCECGADGMGCAAHTAKWSLFWPSVSQPNLPVKFSEWATADAPGNRRGMIGPSKNVDDHEELATVTLDNRFTANTGDWTKVENGGAKGAFRTAKADGKSSATVSLKGAVQKPGIYEVWAYVPLGIAAAETTVTVKTSKGTTQGTLDSHTVGGGYHRVKGLESVVLQGGDDSVIFASASEVEGKSIVADALVLRRSAPITIDPSMQVASKGP